MTKELGGGFMLLVLLLLGGLLGCGIVSDVKHCSSVYCHEKHSYGY
jgi:hypothetical protein